MRFQTDRAAATRSDAGIKFPGIKQVFRIRRQVFDLYGQRLSKEYVHGVTSLDADQATAEQLLRLVRHHWRVEVNHQFQVTYTPKHASWLNMVEIFFSQESAG